MLWLVTVVPVLVHVDWFMLDAALCWCHMLLCSVSGFTCTASGTSGLHGSGYSEETQLMKQLDQVAT